MADPESPSPNPALTVRSQPLAAVLCLQLPLPLIGPDCRARFDALLQFSLQAERHSAATIAWPMLPVRRSRPKPPILRACATSSASANSTPGGPASISIGDIAGRSKIYISGSRGLSECPVPSRRDHLRRTQEQLLRVGLTHSIDAGRTAGIRRDGVIRHAASSTRHIQSYRRKRTRWVKG